MHAVNLLMPYELLVDSAIIVRSMGIRRRVCANELRASEVSLRSRSSRLSGEICSSSRIAMQGAYSSRMLRRAMAPVLMTLSFPFFLPLTTVLLKTHVRVDAVLCALGGTGDEDSELCAGQAAKPWNQGCDMPVYG